MSERPILFSGATVRAILDGGELETALLQIDLESSRHVASTVWIVVDKVGIKYFYGPIENAILLAGAGTVPAIDERWIDNDNERCIPSLLARIADSPGNPNVSVTPRFIKFGIVREDIRSFDCTFKPLCGATHGHLPSLFCMSNERPSLFRRAMARAIGHNELGIMRAFKLINIPLGPRDAFTLGAFIPFVKPKHVRLLDGMAAAGHPPQGCEYSVPSRFCEPLDYVASIPRNRHREHPSYRPPRIRRSQFNGHLIHPSIRRAGAQVGDQFRPPSFWG
ncbi:hypothetical protein BJN34_14385 [Cupriavidus necator]|uniref:Uncharacterized protein n=1 Tax=Cupriavidus necator TaxID=106590 RepID=A0A1U9UQM2_CUPNE|nr:hypothetical protein BJN34_14385 [Cupriavidus necator]